MGFKLYAPGKRHGNRNWIARVWWRGEEAEVSTQTTDPRAAKRFAERLEGRPPVSSPDRPSILSTKLEPVLPVWCPFTWPKGCHPRRDPRPGYHGRHVTKRTHWEAENGRCRHAHDRPRTRLLLARRAQPRGAGNDPRCLPLDLYQRVAV